MPFKGGRLRFESRPSQEERLMLTCRARSSSRIILLLFLFLLVGLGGAALRGQPAHLVRDINPGPPSSFGSWDGFDGDGTFVPHSAEHEGLLLFGADDGVSGRELWRSDGTAEGTFRVQDLVPGADSSYPAWMTPFAGSIVFRAGFFSGNLWRTDGTPEGTERFGPSDLNAWQLTPFEGSLFFHGWTPEFANEPWTSDGTTAGTTVVKDIFPGGDDGDLHNGGPYSSYPRYLTVFGGTIFFAAYQQFPSPGDWLWKSDGTEAGTVTITNTMRAPRDLFDNRGVLFFRAEGAGAGLELWKSDGTAAGTVLVKDIRPGLEASHPGYVAGKRLVALGGGLVLFSANDGVSGDELWRSDGTEAGTVLVRDISPGPGHSDPLWLTLVDGKAYFSADDGVHGRELWVTDGTEAGTRLVKDLFPGESSSSPHRFFAEGPVLAFTASDGSHGAEPWRSDGTEMGTRILQDIAPGAASSDPRLFQPAGTKLYFAADDGVTGLELWAMPRTALLATFADVPADHWAWPFVEALVDSGLTGGCGQGRYCPDQAVTRAEAAVFAVRGVHGTGFVPPPATGTVFEDVSAGFWAAPWIEQLAADGLTRGCNLTPPLYCPERLLTRAEIAVLLLRAKHGNAYTPPPATGTVFTDVPVGYWAPWIEQLAAEGITGGCAPGLYCPDNPVTRAEMAVFLTKTFNLPLP
jgi:ELWxxDGT repeat protein